MARSSFDRAVSSLITDWLCSTREAPVGLRELRKQRGLSLEAVAVLAGLDIGTISRVERGLRSPTPETIVRLGRALGISAQRMRQILAEMQQKAG
jgi:transcriptional regulator with XRE-family HTH domain